MDEQNCGTSEEVREHLENTEGQVSTFEGLNSEGQLLEVYVGDVGGAWNIVLTDPSIQENVQSCVIIWGDYYSYHDGQNPENSPSEPMTAAEMYSDYGSVAYSDLPALFDHFGEAAYWSGADGDNQYVISVNPTGQSFHLYWNVDQENSHPHSENSMQQAHTGDTLKQDYAVGSGIPKIDM